jgi:hypothetical protein
MSIAPVSMKHLDSLTAYRIVGMTTTGLIFHADTTTVVPIGVTQDNSNSPNQLVPVAIGGIAKVYCNDSIAAGGLVGTDAVGRAIPYVVVSTGSYFVGINVGPKVNATGALAEILIRPTFTTANA